MTQLILDRTVSLLVQNISFHTAYKLPSLPRYNSPLFIHPPKSPCRVAYTHDRTSKIFHGMRVATEQWTNDQRVQLNQVVQVRVLARVTVQCRHLGQDYLFEWTSFMSLILIDWLCKKASQPINSFISQSQEQGLQCMYVPNINIEIVVSDK